jgi:hypothetical protein
VLLRHGIIRDSPEHQERNWSKELPRPLKLNELIAATRLELDADVLALLERASG